MTLQLSIEEALTDVIEREGYFASSYSPSNGTAIRANFGSLVSAPMPVQATYSNPFYDSFVTT
jgi:hypothetical protein